MGTGVTQSSLDGGRVCSLGHVVPWQQINHNNYEHHRGLEWWIDDEGHSVRDEQCFYARSESRPAEDKPEANVHTVYSK